MKDDVGFLDLVQRGAERLDQLVRQAGDEADGIGDDRRPSAGQLQPPQGGVEGGEQHVLRHHRGAGKAVEQGRLAGVGVAHQGDGRERHAAARAAGQGAGAPHLFQLSLQPRNLLCNQSPVGFDLGFAGAAHGAEAAALTLEVGPGAH